MLSRSIGAAVRIDTGVEHPAMKNAAAAAIVAGRHRMQLRADFFVRIAVLDCVPDGHRLRIANSRCSIPYNAGVRTGRGGTREQENGYI